MERPYTPVLEPLPRDGTACTAAVSFETSLRRDEDGVGEVIGDGVGRCGVVRCLVHAKSCISLVRMSGELASCSRRRWSTDGFSRVRVWVTSRRWAALCSFGAGAETAALTTRLSSRSRCTVPDADAAGWNRSDTSAATLCSLCVFRFDDLVTRPRLRSCELSSLLRVRLLGSGAEVPEAGVRSCWTELCKGTGFGAVMKPVAFAVIELMAFCL
jgi:hypothetical protein